MTSELPSRFVEVGGWWLQGVVVGYERARGTRERHQTAGGYSASAPRKVADAEDRLFAARAGPAPRSEWLAGPPGIATATPSRLVRVRCAEGSRLEVRFTPGGARKPDPGGADAVRLRKTAWKERPDALPRLLADRPG